MRSNPSILLGFAIVFALIGMLVAFRAYQTSDIMDGGFAALGFAAAAVWVLRYRAERHFRRGL